MFNYDYSRKTRMLIQIVSSLFGFFNIINISIMFKSYKSSVLVWQILYFVALSFLIYALIRMSMKKIFKLESILYYIMNIVAIILISLAVLYIGAEQELSIGIGHILNFILFSIPQMILVSILSIIGIVKTCVSKSKQSIISVEDYTK